MDFNPQFDYIEPYDCTDPVNEPRPDSVVYQPVFEKLTSSNRRVGYILRDTLSNSAYQNSVTRGLIEELKKRSKEDANEQTMFAISGDMAAGKSSVINSILSIGTIARKGAGGGSCTWVVQRFMKKFQDQNSPFAAKVTFFSKDEIKSIMASMLSKYFRATNAASRNSSDDDEEDDDATEALDSRSENYSEIKTVMDAFLSLFCEDGEFATDEAVHKYLRHAEPEDDEDIIEDLTRRAVEIVDDHLAGQEAIVVEAATTDELLYRL